MSSFECKVYKLKIEEHPNADAIELARVGDYRSIVRKGQFKDGDLGVYIPTGSVLPEWMLRELNLWDENGNKGKLSGKQGVRVKEIRLRGQLSEGLIYPVYVDKHPTDYYVAGELECDREYVAVGDDVAEYLGIVKYEPPIPSSMSGEVFNAFGKTLKFDIENIKKFPDVLVEGEEVVMTEKLHGTWHCMGYHPEITHPVVTSKGLSEKGLAFKMNEANNRNLYVQTLFNTIDETGDDVVTRIRRANFFGDLEPFYILGEVFGKGVQDLNYGLEDKQFRAFDVYVGEPGQGRYLDTAELLKLCEQFQIQTVPLLYRGPFSKEIAETQTNGDTTFGSHMREGIVIKPTINRKDPEIGRAMVKSVSEKYLLRKGNVSEYT